MKVLLIDQDGVGLSLVLRSATAGHEVKWFIKPKESTSAEIGKGFKGVEKVDNWVAHVKWADLILCTGNDDYIERLEFFRKRGYPVLAPSVESTKLETDYITGMKLLEKVGIECVPHQTFKTMAEAESHVLKTEEKFVFRYLENSEDKSLTYVSRSPADLIAWMRRTPVPKGEVMLQQVIKGTEVRVSRFMGTKGWVGQCSESFEYGSAKTMGAVAYFTSDSKLCKETLNKLEDELVKLNHLGEVALSLMIDEAGKLWPTEWTCRPGWPTASLALGATQEDPIAWMRDATVGKDTTSFKEDIGCCLVLAQAEFVSGIPIYGVTPGNRQHVHPQSVQFEKLPDMVGGKVVERRVWSTAGDCLAVITGFGKDVRQATKRAYKTADQLYIANSILQDDVGEGLEEELPKLHAMEYASHCSYGNKE
jgi:phosphoribosylamine-glycine ligase